MQLGQLVSNVDKLHMDRTKAMIIFNENVLGATQNLAGEYWIISYRINWFS